MDNCIRVAIAQSRDGHTTVVGPEDYEQGEHSDAMEAAICWSIEAGYIPVSLSWANVSLPPIPEKVDLQAAAERGEFPKSIVRDWDA